MNRDLLDLLAELGRRATSGDIDVVVAALGPRTLTMPDDVHVAPDDDRLEAIGVHRRAEPTRLEITMYVEPESAPDAHELDDVLGAGRAQIRRPGDFTGTVFEHAVPLDWHLPATSVLTCTRDHDDRATALTIEVPVVSPTRKSS